MSEHLLTLLIVLPLLGAAVMLFLPRQSPHVIRVVSTTFMIVTMAFALGASRYRPAAEQAQPAE